MNYKGLRKAIRENKLISETKEKLLKADIQMRGRVLQSFELDRLHKSLHILMGKIEALEELEKSCDG